MATDMVGLPDGIFGVKLARDAATLWVTQARTLQEPAGMPDVFRLRRGVFVTITKSNKLRGCVGFAQPATPLGQCIIRSAVSACEDPRFPSLRNAELEKVLFELSLLTEPVPISAEKPQECQKSIRIGKDGLIITRGMRSALLLPQVPAQYGWNAGEYLENLCVKAGLQPGQWKDGLCKIYKFETQIFAEMEPAGDAVKIDAAAKHSRPGKLPKR